MKKIRLLIIFAVAGFFVLGCYLYSINKSEPQLLETYTYIDETTNSSEVESTDIDIDALLGTYAEGFSEFFGLGPVFEEMHEDAETMFNKENLAVTKDNLNKFSELNQIELTEEDFDIVNMNAFKGYYDQFKDKIKVYYNTSENLYIADIRTEKTPIEINCELVEENNKDVYKYEIKYGNDESVFEGAYEGEGVIVLLISDSSCLKIDEKDLYSTISFGENLFN